MHTSESRGRGVPRSCLLINFRVLPYMYRRLIVLLMGVIHDSRSSRGMEYCARGATPLCRLKVSLTLLTLLELARSAELMILDAGEKKAIGQNAACIPGRV